MGAVPLVDHADRSGDGLLYQGGRLRHAAVESRQRVIEMARMNRRAVAGQMSATIAHEVNQPLTAILSSAETAQSLLGRSRSGYAP
jgi:C4-dicarboxylate-specific signal transduction histidine kinase